MNYHIHFINKYLILNFVKKIIKMIDLEQIIKYSKNKNLVSEETPFGEGVLVYKVAGKIFLFLSIDEFPYRISVKCKPDIAIELREKYPYVIGGYHLNKTHWNTIILENNVNFDFILEQIDNSYNLIVNTLSKKIQSEILKF